MKRRRSYLFWKISSILFSLLVVLTALQAVVIGYYYGSFSLEATQMRHWDLAGELAEVIQPTLVGRIDQQALDRKLAELNIFFPHVKIYLLDEEGNIEAFMGTWLSNKLPKVNLGPIREFLKGTEISQLPIYGDNPQGNQEAIFSAAPIVLGKKDGFLYAVLDDKHERIGSWLIGQSYVLRSAGTALLISLLIVSALGTAIFFILTRRVLRIIEGIRCFQRGDYQSRIAVSGTDEITEVADTFNAMAGTIVENMDALEEKDHLRRQLVATVSHDLKGPITSMRTGIETLVTPGLEIKERQRAQLFAGLLRSLEHLNRLVSELFELSKLEARETPPEFRNVSLGDFLGNIALKYEPLVEDTQIELKVSTADGIPEVRADPGMLERVVSNLVENAIAFTPAGGSVSIVAETLGEKVQIAVVDSGVGIAEKDIAKIFDPFYRGSKDRINQQGGTGLGLAIVSKIIETHGSSIAVQSAVGSGTTFSFCLDCA